MPDVRTNIVSWGKTLLANKARMNYAEIRPIPLHNPPKFPLTTDCSGFVTLCYYLAGAPDPNGLKYSGQGYTGTLLSHGRHITKEQALAGDVIVYGGGTGEHTALIIEAGADPVTISHGQQGDPSIVRVSQDGRLPQTYLRFNTNKLPVTVRVANRVKVALRKKA